MPDLCLPSSRLFDITYQKKIPLLCTFELTHTCNLRCVHCYIDDRAAPTMLSTATVKRALRQLAKAGCLYIVFTGGEIFLRQDIVPLTAYARKLGFDVRLFTNGTLITENAARALAGLHVSNVEISVYGRAATHDRVTAAPGSFDAAIAAIKTLRRYGVPVTIKSPVMKPNKKDITWLSSLSKRLGAALKLDPTIAPKNNGDKSNLANRLRARDLKTLYRDLAPAFSDAPSLGGASDFWCSAGHNLVAINAAGKVQPCIQIPLSIGDINRRSLRHIWSLKNRAMARYRNLKENVSAECSSCTLTQFCQRCPGLAILEDGDINGPSRIACQIARVRRTLSSQKGIRG